MKKTFLAMALMLSAITTNAQKAHITGKITNYNGTNVMTMDALSLTGKTTPLAVNKDGSFAFDMDSNTPGVYYLILENPKSGFKFYVENGMEQDIQVSFKDSTLMGQKITVAIPTVSEKYKEISKFLENISYFDAQNKVLEKIQKQPMSFAEFREDLRYEVDKLEGEIMKIDNANFRSLMKDDFEKKYQNSLIWYTEFTASPDSTFIAWTKTLDKNNPEKLVDAQMYASAYKKYFLEKGIDKNLAFFKGLTSHFKCQQNADAITDQEISTVLQNAPANIDEVFAAYKAVNPSRQVPATIQQLYEHYKKMTVGQKAVNFDMYTKDGKKVVLSDLKGKAVYLDCWATWCGPCKAEIPHMAKLYEHYKNNKNIVLVSVSLDKNVNAWKAMVKKDNPGWPQYIVKDEFNSSLCKNYNITGIPRFMMFDKKGNIISLDAPRPSSDDIIEWIDNNLK